MMKYFMLFATALCLMACGKPASTTVHQETVNQQAQESQILIIFYDKTQTNTEQLVEQGKKWHLELVYDYRNLNGLAIRVPNKNDVESVKEAYRNMKGVLSIKEDQINQLH